MLKAGQAAPMFVLPDADMEYIDISQYHGKNNVILVSDVSTTFAII